MNYDTMKAGRKMDLLVAVKVMGWERPRARSVTWYCPSGFGCSEGDIPRYSISISDAWKVMERMHETHNTIFDMWRNGHNWGCYWGCKQERAIISDTAPLAICRAALKAVEET